MWLPGMPLSEVSSIHLPTLNGKHPSNFQFAIEGAERDQIQAWLAGDFERLQGIFLLDSLGDGSKGNMFGKVEEHIAKARATLDKVRNLGKFIGQFDGSSLVDLPVGLPVIQGDGTQVTIVISRISLFPTHAELTVYAEVFTPNMEKPLIFGSPDIRFSRRAGIQAGALGLLGDFAIDIFQEKATLEFVGAQIGLDDEFIPTLGTYAKFACDSLSEFNLDVSLALSREWVLPVSVQDSVPQIIENERVTAALNLNLSNGLNDMLTEIDFSHPFVHVNKQDLVWTVQDVVFDFSESRHAASLSFPVAEYTPAVPQVEMWQGVYIGQVGVKLPEQLFGAGPETIMAEDIIIDENGFTGLVEVTPLFSLEDGDLSGWPFSVDWLKVQFYQNDLAAFEFDGMINLPVFNSQEDGTPEAAASLEYYAAFDFYDGIYEFATQLTEEKVFESRILQATVTIEPTSYIHVIAGGENGFDVSATLHGRLEVDTEIGENGPSLRVPEVRFENLVLGNRGAFVRNAGTWDVDSIAVKMNGFSFNIDNIGLAEGDSPDEVFLFFIAKVNLGQHPVDISADGGFRIAGRVETLENGRQNWHYDRFIVDALFIDAETPSFEFDGYVLFFEDMATYGDGFQGKLSITFKSLGSEIGLDAIGLFGSVDTTRYFFVDVMAKIPAGILTTGGIDFRGLGGGVYMNMRQQTLAEDFSSAGSNLDDIIDLEPNSPVSDFEIYRTQLLNNYLGTSLSGITYVPDPSVKLGVNAAVVIATKAEEVFNANLVFNIEINSNGGVNHIRLAGFANAMSPISWTGPSCEGVSIRFLMQYESGNVTETGNGRFTAQAQVFIKLAKLRGLYPIDENTAANGDGLPNFYIGSECEQLYYAGGIDILFSKDDWHINIGIPNRTPPGEPLDTEQYPFPHYPIGLAISTDSTNANHWLLTSYLDIGNNIPPFPGLPANVEELVGLGNLLQNESSRASGQGFAFGARLYLHNELDVWGIVSAHLTLDVGFDIMLQRYQDAICVNNGNEPLGINGWYAAGQAWAYVEGGVSVLGFNIMQAALAAAIQVKGPNPTYGRGAIAGRYSVLGGLKKGEFRFPLKFGKECELEGGGSVELDLEIIAGLLPIDGARDVPVEAQPDIMFSYPVGEMVALDSDGDGESDQYFIIELDEFRVELDEMPVAGQLVWSEDSYSAGFQPEDMLQAEGTYVIFATASLYETDEDGNIQGGPSQMEEKTHTFITGKDLAYIPVGNVQAAWPANRQFNFYQGEPVSNFIQLERGQDDLMDVPNNVDKLLRISNANEFHEVSFSYSATTNRISYDLPALSAGKAYKGQLILKENSSGPQDIVSQDAEPEGLIYTFYFRVSNYASYLGKMSSVMIGGLAPSNVLNENDLYEAVMSGLSEPFGAEEVVGSDQLGDIAVIAPEANLGSTSWMNSFRSFGDSNFDLYGTSCNVSIVNQDYEIPILGVRRQELGAIPNKAIFLSQGAAHLRQVTAENYQVINEQGELHEFFTEAGTAKVIYAVPMIIKRDFDQMQHITSGRMVNLTALRSNVTLLRQEMLDGPYCTNTKTHCGDQQVRPGQPVTIPLGTNLNISSDLNGDTMNEGFEVVNPAGASMATTNDCGANATYKDCLTCCCNEDDGFAEFIRSNTSILMESNICQTIYWDIEDSNLCRDLGGTFLKKTIDVDLTANSNYPVKFSYAFPNGTQTDFAVNLTTQL